MNLDDTPNINAMFPNGFSISDTQNGAWKSFFYSPTFPRHQIKLKEGSLATFSIASSAKDGIYKWTETITDENVRLVYDKSLFSDFGGYISSNMKEFEFRFYRQVDGSHVIYSPLNNGRWLGYDAASDTIIPLPFGDERIQSWFLIKAPEIKGMKTSITTLVSSLSSKSSYTTLLLSTSFEKTPTVLAAVLDQKSQIETKSSNTTSASIIIWSVISIIVFVIASIGIFLYFKFKRQTVEMRWVPKRISRPKVSFPGWLLGIFCSETATRIGTNLELISEIASGGFGSVHKGRYKGKIVAVKMLLGSKVSQDNKVKKFLTCSLKCSNCLLAKRK